MVRTGFETILTAEDDIEVVAQARVYRIVGEANSGATPKRSRTPGPTMRFDRRVSV
jgi:hypothetical protein